MNIYEIQNKIKNERLTIFDLPLKVCFYARVSTTLDAQLNSIDNQQQYFLDYIKKQENWEFVKGYADEIRGESAKNRPEFLKMVEDAKNGEIDLIITKEISRFSRNTLDSLKYTQELYKNGVGVYFLNDNICTLDTDSELRLTIMSSIAQDEVRKLSERIKFGHRQAIKNGRVLGNNRIFGYDLIDCKLEINKKESEMVKLIYELFVSEEYSLRDIEKHLYSNGFRGRSGTKIMHNTIGNIIKNPKYKGFYCGNKVKSSDYKEQKQIFVPKEEWVLFKDETIPPIVSEKLWNKANSILEKRSSIIKNNRSSIKKDSVFTGKLFCKEHNVPLWKNARSKNSKTMWQCSLKRRINAKACDMPNIYEEEIERIIAESLQQFSEEICSYSEKFFKVLRKINNEQIEKIDISALNNDIKKIETKINNIIDMTLEGILTKETARKKLEELEDEKNIKILKLKDIENSKEIKEKKVQTLKDIITFFKNEDIKDYKNIDKKRLQKIINTIIVRMYLRFDVNKKEFSIDIIYNTPNSTAETCTTLHSVQMVKKMIESYQNSVK